MHTKPPAQNVIGRGTRVVIRPDSTIISLRGLVGRVVILPSDKDSHGMYGVRFRGVWNQTTPWFFREDEIQSEESDK